MSFNVNDKVTVVDSGKQYSSYDKWVKIHASQWVNQWKRWQSIDTSLEYTVVAKGEHEDCDKMLYLIQCDDKVYIIGEQGIKAVETVGFKVGDVVKVTKNIGGTSEFNGKQGIIKAIRRSYKPEYCYAISFDGTNNTHGIVFCDEELELATATHDSKDIIKRSIDGERWTLPEWDNVYLVFGNGKLRYSDGGAIQWWSWEHRKDWVKYTAPPKFTINSLVYNTDGTIGKIVEDKGVCKGVRRYSVSFNAIRDTVKSVDEAELTEYKQ